jgi:hypothetical protein
VSVSGLGSARAESDFTLPVLVAFERTSPDIVGPGDTITVAYEAYDTGVGLGSVTFEYQDPTLKRIEVHAQWPAPSVGVATGTIPATSATGIYELARVTVWDQATNISTYFPGGPIGKTPQNGVGADHHSFDLPAANFTVVNLQADVIAPTLKSLERTSTSTPAAGETLTISFEAFDLGGEGIDYASFRFVGPAGELNRDVAQYFDTSSASGVAKWTIRTSAPTGTYRLTEVEMWDQAQNRVTYKRDGSVVGYPNVVQPPTHLLNLSALDVTIDNPNGDIDAPVLLSVARTSPPVVRPGDLVTLDWTGSDVGSKLSCISLMIEGPVGNILGEEGGYCPQMPAQIRVPPAAPSGLYRLRQFYLEDSAGYRSEYVRDGRIDVYPDGVHAPASHALDFSRADFIVDNGPGPTTTTSTTSTTIANQAPVPKFGQFAQTRPHWVFANGAPSIDNDGSITKYEWRWGDGSKPSTFKYSWHQYKQAGWYLIRLTVTDNKGAATTRGIWYRAN